MTRLDKEDLAQMTRDYFQSLDKESLVEVAFNLRSLAVEQWEKLQQNSENSSKPPSSDNPYSNTPTTDEKRESQESELSQEKEKKGFSLLEKKSKNKLKRKPGKQPGSQGKWRSQPLKAEEVVPHHPHHCAACNKGLGSEDPKPYMGHYVLELKQEESGIPVGCQLHHYYQATCSCGHITQAKPGTGYVSEVEGRARDLKLTEYALVGPMLASFIASLGVRYRMSRAKIQEFLFDWVKTELSVGTIDRCIREAGIACVPVVEELVEQLPWLDHPLDCRSACRLSNIWGRRGVIYNSYFGFRVACGAGRT